MKIGREILWLSENDVHSLLPMNRTLSVVEDAFRLYGQGEVEMPAKVYLDFSPIKGDLRAMPAYVKGSYSSAGVKIVNSHPDNPTKKLPAVAGVLVLNDPETGLPISVMAAGVLTGMRTGAAGGVAVKHLSRENASVVGLVGCGKQAQTQLDAILQVRSIKKVWVWGKTIEESQSFCTAQQSQNKIEFVPVANVGDACQADIVVTTTPVKTPLVQADMIKPGTHINAIGADAPGKQELSVDVLKKSRVFVDEMTQAVHAGEINVPVTQGKFSKEEVKAELGHVITKAKAGRESENDITLFDSTGLALQDMATAKVVFDEALKLKKGKVLKVHG